MFSLRVVAAALTVLILTAGTGVAAEDHRETLYERQFADGFVANEQAYIVMKVPEGYLDVRLEVDCNLHVGTITLSKPFTEEVGIVCDGLLERVVADGLEPGYYYGVASFTGVNGVDVRVTGVPA